MVAYHELSSQVSAERSLGASVVNSLLLFILSLKFRSIHTVTR